MIRTNQDARLLLPMRIPLKNDREEIPVSVQSHQNIKLTHIPKMHNTTEHINRGLREDYCKLVNFEQINVPGNLERNSALLWRNKPVPYLGRKDAC